MMESGEDLELTLDDFQNWYDEKGSKTDNSKVSYHFIYLFRDVLFCAFFSD